MGMLTCVSKTFMYTYIRNTLISPVTQTLWSHETCFLKITFSKHNLSGPITQDHSKSYSKGFSSIFKKNNWANQIISRNKGIARAAIPSPSNPNKKTKTV